MRNHTIDEISGGLLASEDDLTALNELWEAVNREFWPEDPPKPPAETIADFRSEPGWSRAAFFVAREDDRVIGASRIWWWERDEDPDKAFVGVGVHPGHRRRGLAAELLEPVVERAKLLGRALVFGNVMPGSAGESFARTWGAVPAVERGSDKPHASRESRLPLDELDGELLESWIARAAERASDYDLEFWAGATPPGKLEEFAHLTDVMNDAPTAEGSDDWHFSASDVQEYESRSIGQGYQPWTFLARHVPTGEAGGFTRVWPNPFREEFVIQEDTGVHPRHRDKGLGRWLKAAMLIKLRDERPRARWVRTWNAVTNRAMLNINEALGFRKWTEWVRYEKRL